MKRAMEMVLTGDPISAQEALKYGLINKVVPDDKVFDVAMELAEKISSNAPLAVYASRNLTAKAFSESDEKLWSLGLETFIQKIAPSEDFREGPRSFIEKRAPKWQGK